MEHESLINDAKKYFPKLKIKYKDKSFFMKMISYLLFFNKKFMTSYTTTVGSTIYIPDEKYMSYRSTSSIIVLLHEFVHIYDSKNIFYKFLYLFPQSLILFCIPLFLLSWKIALPLTILFSLPLPAYFRMYYEKRAYLASLYVLFSLGNKRSFNPLLLKQRDFFVKQFKTADYYYMWLSKKIDKQFNEATDKILKGEKPYNDPVFDILDKILEKL